VYRAAIEITIRRSDWFYGLRAQALTNHIKRQDYSIILPLFLANAPLLRASFCLFNLQVSTKGSDDDIMQVFRLLFAYSETVFIDEL
jgi:hypothetical protein